MTKWLRRKGRTARVWMKKLDRVLLRVVLYMLTSLPTLAFVERAWLVTLIVRFIKLTLLLLLMWALYHVFLSVVLFFSKESNDCNTQRSKGLGQNDPNIIVPQCLDNGKFAALQCDGHGACQCWTQEGIPINEKSNAIKACDCLMVKHHGENAPIGGFQPKCDTAGYYEIKQCWASTGMCWCSDKSGNKLTEPTKNEINCETNCLVKQKEIQALNDPKAQVPKCESDGTYSAMQCDTEDGPCECWSPEGSVVKEKSPDIKFCGCFIELHKGKKTPIGGFQPKCDANGFYKPKQFWPSTGMSWCSDKHGKRLTEPARGEVNCEETPTNTDNETSTDNATAASEMTTVSSTLPCQKKREDLLEQENTSLDDMIPTCLEEGTFVPIQCDDEGKICQCVATDGTIIREKSDKIRFCDCFLQQDTGKKNKFGGFQPKCDDNGYYEVKQCRPSSGMCWCSDKYGNKTTEPVRGDPKCPVEAASNCKADRDDKLQAAENDSTILVPVCEDDGSYSSIQCGDEGACQCVAPNGEVIKEMSEHTLLCECFLHQHRGKENKFGGFQPNCTEEGYYESKQCSTSSGACWCSDKYGNKTSEKKRGDVSCPVTAMQQTCKNRREELEKKNDQNETIPTCLDDGSYAPMQCDEKGLTCQCSTPDGELISDKSDKLKFCGCLLHQNHAKQRRIGGFQPKCDEEGFYESKQCSSSSGMCWCSDRHGNKVTKPTRGEVTCETSTTNQEETTVSAPLDCEAMKENAEKDSNATFVPKCELDGSFSPLQCNVKKECQCWSPEGIKINEDFSPELKYCNCFIQLYNINEGVIGNFKPKCQKDGYYEKMQCSESTGMCWCVSKFGRKLTEPKKDHPDC